MRVGQSRKRDANEPRIVGILQAVGVKVQRISERGFADLICLSPRAGVVLLEVKSEKGKLTDAQVEHRQDGWPVIIVRNEQQALEACGYTWH